MTEKRTRKNRTPAKRTSPAKTDGDSDAAEAADGIDQLFPELGDLPEKQRMAVASMMMRYSGPLPTPDMMKGYNDAIPDGAERIMRNWEDQ